MRIRRMRFNPYLLLALLVLVGCESQKHKRKQQLTTLRIYVETNSTDTNHVSTISVFRRQPFTMRVEKEPFISERDVSEAKIVQTVGGFSVHLQFGHEGTLLLEQYSAMYRGKHFAIFSQFADEPGGPINTGRWLAAPLVTQPIRDGSLTFTPDATREEAEQIIVGLNNDARMLDNKPK